MRAIYKYELPTYGMAEVDLPAGAQILSIQTQRNIPNIWALVNPDAPVERRRFRVHRTGLPIDADTQKGNYIATFQLHDGALVFHVFEVAEDTNG